MEFCHLPWLKFGERFSEAEKTAQGDRFTRPQSVLPDGWAG